MYHVCIYFYLQAPLVRILNLPASILIAEGLTEYAWQVHNSAELIQGGIGAFQAAAIVLTGIALALINILFTVLSLVASMAFTEIVLHLIYALGAIRAWIRHAFINIQLTVLALVSRAAAVAMETTQLVYAEAIVEAGRRDAVIDVNVTYATRHTRYAGAREIVNHINTSGAIRARIANALVNINFAVLPLIARLAVARVSIDLVFQKEKTN